MRQSLTYSIQGSIVRIDGALEQKSEKLVSVVYGLVVAVQSDFVKRPQCVVNGRKPPACFNPP